MKGERVQAVLAASTRGHGPREWPLASCVSAEWVSAAEPGFLAEPGSSSLSDSEGLFLQAEATGLLPTSLFLSGF